MSVEAMTWAFTQPIPPAPKVVLLALANEANKLGQHCFPSLATLAENCAPMKKRTIQNHLRWLATEAKLITVKPWFTERGRQTSNVYELQMTTLYCGEGAEHCIHRSMYRRAREGAESCRGRVQKAAGGRVQELLHGEGVRAVAPSDKNLNPVVDPLEGLSADAAGGRRRVAKSASTYEGFRNGYHKRYGVDPLRDALVNTDLCRLVDRVGQEDAPAVAEFYLTLEDPLYLRAGHPTSLLVRDYQAIRTRWKTGRRQVCEARPRDPLPKAYQAGPVTTVQGDGCPEDAQAVLSKILGRQAFSFAADTQCERV